MFGKPDKKKTVEVNGQQVALQPKPSPFSRIFPGGLKTSAPRPPSSPSVTPPTQQKPQPSAPPQQNTAPAPQQPAAPQPNKPYEFKFPVGGFRQVQPKAAQNPSARPQPLPSPAIPTPPNPYMKPSASPKQGVPGQPSPNRMMLLIEGIGTKHSDLENAMRKEGMKEPVYDFVKRMLMVSLAFTAAVSIISALILYRITGNPLSAMALGLLIAMAVFIGAFRTFLNFPIAKGRSSSKRVERDIIFAARDLIIALRSGMPLFNAITSVSSGYGEASKEFLKIVEKVQLGTPLEDAIDQVVSATRSASFRKIMLQASVSIRVGADVISALQSIIDQLAQERVIELRRYGQRLNAIAMFYMLFGIILPSMGIAVLTILTTFIPIFQVDSTLLEMVVIGIVFLQIVFLQLIRSSRPVFSM